MKNLLLLLLPLLFSGYSLAMPKVEFKDLKIENQPQLALFVTDVTQLQGNAAQIPIKRLKPKRRRAG